MATRRVGYTEIEQKEDEHVELQYITNDADHVIHVHDDDRNANHNNIDNGMNLKCLDGFKTTKHVNCWLLTIILWIFIISQTTCSIISHYGAEKTCKSVCNAFHPCSNIIMIIFGLCYFLYIIDICCYSSSYKYICSQNKINNEDAKQYIDNIKNVKVTMSWKGEWYHRYQDPNDGAKDVDIITYTESGRFQYASCINKTEGNLPQIIDKLASNYGIIHISFGLEAKFANQITENEYNKQFKTFQAYFINLKADRQYRFEQFIDFKHLSKHTSLAKCIYIEKKWNKPRNLNIGCYLLAALLLILPCYRMWITTLIGNNKYQLKKCHFVKVFNSFYDNELLVHAFFGCVYYPHIKEQRLVYLPNSLANLIAKFCPKRLMVSQYIQ